MSIRALRRLGNTVLLMAATAWLVTDRGWEPLIGVLSLFGGLVIGELLDARATRPGSSPTPSPVTTTSTLLALDAAAPDTPRVPAVLPRSVAIPPSLVEPLRSPRAFKTFLSRERASVPLLEASETRLEARLTGLPVNWVLEVISLRQEAGSRIHLGCASELAFVDVLGLDPKAHPDLRFLKKGERIRVVGTIKSFDTLTTYIEAQEVTLLGASPSSA